MLFTEYTDHLDPTVYDLKAMNTDYDNGNFSISCTPLDNYRMNHIVLESALNGQSISMDGVICDIYDDSNDD